MKMTNSRPYMVRSLYEWIIDNNSTPYLLVNAMAEGTMVPADFINEGQIVLNIAPGAVRDLLMSNEAVEFNGRFGGVPMHVYVPTHAVMAIYTRENGQGMVFDDDMPAPEAAQEPKAPLAPSALTSTTGPVGEGDKPAKAKSTAKANRPSLKIVK